LPTRDQPRRSTRNSYSPPRADFNLPNSPEPAKTETKEELADSSSASAEQAETTAASDKSMEDDSISLELGNDTELRDLPSTAEEPEETKIEPMEV